MCTFVVYDHTGSLFVSGNSNSDCSDTNTENGPITTNSNWPEFPLVRTSGLEYIHEHNDESDAFVCKFNTNHELEWSTQIGGSLYDYMGVEGKNIAFDSNFEYLLIGGITYSNDFPYFPLAGSNLNDNAFDGSYEAFLIMFNGNYDLVWSTYLGGNGNDSPQGIAVSETDEIYIALASSSTDFYPIASSTGAYYQGYNGSTEGYIIKFNFDGFSDYATYLGGSQADVITGIDCKKNLYDNQNDLVVAGFTNSLDFPKRKYSGSINSYNIGTKPGAPSEHHGFITNFHNTAPYYRVRNNTVANVLNQELTNQKKSSHVVYPNPTTGYFEFSFQGEDIQLVELFDISGKCVATKHIFSRSDYLLNISNLYPGYYFIKFSAHDKLFFDEILLIK